MNAKFPIALFLVLASTLAQGETFIGPTTATNRLVVPSNSAIIITTTLGDFTNSVGLAQGQGGYPFPLDYFAPLESGNTYALAGPSELVLSNVALFTFYRLTNAAIFTQSIGNDPVGVSIASNRTMRLFGVPTRVNANFVRPGSSPVSFTLEPGKPAEFTGPGSLSLSSGVFASYIKFISYFIAEDGFALPDQRVVTGPTGSYSVMVEKSLDLNSWTPVLLKSTSDADHAFFRLRIER